MNGKVGLLILFLLSAQIIDLSASPISFGLAQNTTNVAGSTDSWTTWKKDGGPYNLTGPLTINIDKKLTIEAGTTVNLNGYSIQVEGSLSAIGTETEKIYFNGGSPTGQRTFPDGQITFGMYSVGSAIENAFFNSTYGNSIYILSSSVKVNHCTLIGGIFINGVLSSSELSNNFITGRIELAGGTNTIANNTIRGTIYAIGSCQITNNTIIGNGKDEGIHTGGDIPHVSNNVVSGFKIGIRAYYGAKIENNLIINNSQYGIDVGMGYHTIQNNTITQNAIGINSPKLVTTIIYNNIYNNSQYNIFLDFYSHYPISTPSNWWGTTDILAINQTMNIKWNNQTAVKVDFVPILLQPNTEAPTMKTETVTNPTPTSTLIPTQAPTLTPTQSTTPLISPSESSATAPISNQNQPLLQEMIYGAAIFPSIGIISAVAVVMRKRLKRNLS